MGQVAGGVHTCTVPKVPVLGMAGGRWRDLGVRQQQTAGACSPESSGARSYRPLATIAISAPASMNGPNGMCDLRVARRATSSPIPVAAASR